MQIRAELTMMKLTNATVGTRLNALLMAIDKSTETYIGLTENHFKTRYRNHLVSDKDKEQEERYTSKQTHMDTKRKQLKL